MILTGVFHILQVSQILYSEALIVVDDDDDDDDDDDVDDGSAAAILDIYFSCVQK